MSQNGATQEAAPVPDDTNSLAAAVAAMEAAGDPVEPTEPGTPGAVPADPALATPPPAAEPAEPADPAAPAPEPAAQPPQSPSEYYARLTELDRQNRELRQQIKAGVTPSLDQIKQHPGGIGGAVKDLGWSFDDVLSAYAADLEAQDSAAPEEPGRLPPEVAAQIDGLKQEIQAIKQERQQEVGQSALNKEMATIDQFVQSQGETYEMINSLKDEGSIGLVLRTAATIYQQHQIEPDYKDVCDLVEEHLTKQETARITRSRNVAKMKALFAEQAAAKAAAPGAPTLSGAGGDTPEPREELTDAERLQAALKAMESVA